MMAVALLILMFMAAAILLAVLLGRKFVREGQRVGREMVQEERRAESVERRAKGE